MGLLTSDLKYDQMRTVFMTEGAIDSERLDRDLAAAAEELRGRLREDGVADDEIEVAAGLDCRYVGQGYELRIPLPEERFTPEALEEFHRLHEQEYGHAFRDPIEIVNLRVTAYGKRPRIEQLPASANGGDPLLGEGESVFGGTALRRRATTSARCLPVGESIDGAAVVFQRDTTTVVPPGWTARADASGSLDPQPMSAPTTTRVDPITASVIAGALESIAVEMGHKLARMSYSSIIRESEDFGCVICDAQARQLAESSQSTPLQSGPIPGYIRGINRRFAEIGEEWRPGDVVIHNHAYYGASHEPDVGFVVPIFHGGELVAFSATAAHHLDLGALTPGSCGIVDATDAYAEGLQFNAIKIEEEGRRNEWIWRFLRDNVRAAQLVVGDMEAQVAACRIGAERFEELIERYGIETVKAASEDLMDYSERLLRREIEKLPDGSYEAEGFIDGFQDDPNPANRDLRIKATVTVEGSDIHVDLTGTSPQIDLPLNMPFEGTVDIAIYLTIRSILLDSDRHGNIPANSGLFRPITITAPEGCLANPRFPAPDDRALLPGQHRRRHGHARAGAARAGQRQRRGRQPEGRRVLGPQRRRPALGVHGHPGGELRRPARQGRARRGRHPLREHPQQPDRGHRVALPAARDAIRAERRHRRRRTLAWRARHGPRDRVPRARRDVARGRRLRASAAGAVRRRGWDARAASRSTGAARAASRCRRSSRTARLGPAIGSLSSRRPAAATGRRPSATRPRSARTSRTRLLSRERARELYGFED